MIATRTPRFGFRVVGAVDGRRRLVDAGAALAAYATADPKAEVEKEGYLSAYWFADDFKAHLEETGSSKGYDGVCWTPWLWWDIDRKDDLDAALDDTRGLASTLLARYRTLDADDLLLFFSGAKGFHVGLPTVWGPAPAVAFHRTARLFAEALAVAAGATIDASVYDKVRLFRAPNSRHPKTGLHKRRLSLDELLYLSADRIRELAREPVPFDLPIVTATSGQAAADWQAALQAVERESEGKAQRQRAVANGEPRLNRSTLDFIRDGAGEGDRHRLLFSAAANLAEFESLDALAHALLTDAALDAGLTPSNVRRQINCGLAHGAKATAPLAAETPVPLVASAPTAPPPPEPDAIRAALADLWARQATPSSAPVGPAATDTVMSIEEIPDPISEQAGSTDDWTEAQAIAFHGGKPDAPEPPAGARFHYQDERCRPCGAGDAHLWTWEGAPRWYFIADFPAPSAGGHQ